MKKVQKQFGKYMIQMRKFTQIHGHDDSLPYVAELWVNKTHIANCHNDGWGGETLITPVDKTLFDNVSKIVCSTKGAFNMDWLYTMPILADDLASECHFIMTIKEKQKNGLVFQKPNGNLLIIPFNSKNRKCVPIAEMLLTQVGKDLIAATIQKYTNMGYVFLNTNVKQ